MNIDDTIGVALYKPRSKDLHVPSHHHQIDSQFIQECELSLFLIFLVLRGNRKNVERNAERSNNQLEIWVVADDADNIAWDFLDLVPVQQVK